MAARQDGGNPQGGTFHPGMLVGNYQLIRLVGGGGMGVVYEARHPVLDYRIAIKFLRLDVRDASLEERFRNEALAASRLRDERLPQIFGIDQLEDGTSYLVMELLEGQDLAHRMEEGPLEPGYAARVVLEVLEVLSKVHRLGIVHRDLKPANIFLARNAPFLGEIPKLLDFGVAHLASREITQAGEVVGTPVYMAPEQAFGDDAIGPWTDIFSAGVMLFELIAGKDVRPWSCRSRRGYLHALAAEHPPRPLRSVAPHTPEGLSQALGRALAREPEERYPDALAFARAIEPFAISRASLHEVRHPSRSSGKTFTPASAEPPPSAPPAPKAPSTARLPAPPGDSSQPSRATRSVSEDRRLAGLRRQLRSLRQDSGPGEARDSSVPRLQTGERRYIIVMYVSPHFSRLDQEPLSHAEREELATTVLELSTRLAKRWGALVLRQPEGALVGLFGFDRIQEYDAEQAASAALVIRQRGLEVSESLLKLGYAVSFRVGLHSGFANRLDGAQQEPLLGDEPGLASRLAEHAPLNGVLVSRGVLERISGSFRTRPVGRLSLEQGRPPLKVYEILERNRGSWNRALRLPEGVPRPGTGQREVREGAGGGLQAPFVGREAELARLWSEFERLMTGGSGPSLVVVTGAAGMGKTRLVTEFLARAERRDGGPVPVIRAQPLAHRPYGMWAALLHAIFSQMTDVDAVESVLPDLLEELSRTLEPERRAALGVQREVVEMILWQERMDLLEAHSPRALGERIQNAVVLCLEAVARRAATWDVPLIISLEELHRSDVASLALLPRVLEGLRGSRGLLIVLTTRESAALSLPEGLSCVPIALEPLGDGESEALAAALAPEAALSPAVREFLACRSGGHPLFIEEMVLSLREGGLLDASASRLARFILPTSLYGLLLERVERLPHPLRETLRLASVLGVEFEPEVFAALVEAASDSLGLPATRPGPGGALDELVHCGLLERLVSSDGGTLHAFRPAQLQGAVYGTILTENKSVLHHFAALAIERVYASCLGRHSSRLVHHLSKTEDVERLLHYARMAGQRALGMGAYDEATEELMMAVALQEQVARRWSTAAARTLLELATASLWSGRLAQADAQAREVVERLTLGLTMAPGDRGPFLELLGRALMMRGFIGELRADWAGSSTCFEQAERAFTDVGMTAVAAQARCCFGFMLRSSGHPEEGLRLAREGWSVLEDSGDLAAIARAGHDLGNVLRDLGEYDEALRIFDRAMTAGDELRRRGNTFESTWGSLAARSGRAMTYAALGNIQAAIEDQRAVRDLAVLDGNRIALVISEYHLATHLVDGGKLDEAEGSARQAYRMSVTFGMPGRAVKCRLIQARIAELRGDAGRAFTLLEDTERLARKSGLPYQEWREVAQRLLGMLGARHAGPSALYPRASGDAGD